MGIECFKKDIELPLLNQMRELIISLSDDNVGVTDGVSEELFKTNVSGPSMEQQYGLKYPGEVLERYEERCGRGAAYTRAIALALADEKRRLNERMFVGQQYNNFIHQLKRMPEDIYLQVALYMLTENMNEEDKIYHFIVNYSYQNTTEALIAIYALRNRPESWKWIKKLALRFLGKEKTIKVYENTQIYEWFVKQFYQQIQKERDKDSGMLKGFLELSCKNVKEETPSWKRFVNNGYSDQEICFLNLSLAGKAGIPGGMSKHSITAERMALSYCLKILNAEEIENPCLFKLCKKMLHRYKVYQISLEQKKGILDSLHQKVVLNREDTFQYFYKIKGDISEKIDDWFLVDFSLDKWDDIVKWMNPEEYRELFAKSLCSHNCNIDVWLKKYCRLTGKEYTDYFWTQDTFYTKEVMRLLMINGKYNVSEVFSQYIADEKNMSEEERTNKWKIMLSNIGSIVDKLNHHEVFQFWKFFDEHYDIASLGEFCKQYRNPVLEAVGISTYGKYFERFSVNKKFLTEGEEKILFDWTEQLVYREMPKEYKDFLYHCILQEEIRRLFPEESKKLFLMIKETLEEDSQEAQRLYRQVYTKEEWDKYYEAYKQRQEETKRNEKEGLLADYKNSIYQKISSAVGPLEVYSEIAEKCPPYYSEPEKCDVWLKILMERLQKMDARQMKVSDAQKIVESIIKQFGQKRLDWKLVQWIIEKMEVVEDESGEN